MPPHTHAISGHHIVDVEPICGTNDLWLANATRAVKNPGKGDYRTILIGPKTRNVGGKTVLDPEGGYQLRGDIKVYNTATGRLKVYAQSPVPDQAWVASHHAEVFAMDFATARRILIMLAKELVYDRS